MEFFRDADDFAYHYAGYLISQNISLGDAADAYVKMCNYMMKSQIYFMKNGEYPIDSSHLIAHMIMYTLMNER